MVPTPATAHPRELPWIRRPRSWVVIIGCLLALTLGMAGLFMAFGAGRGGAAQGPPHFVDEAATAGVVQRYSGDYPYMVGGGVATFDCDQDGRPDLYFAGGAGDAGLFRNRSEPGGALSFEPVHDATTDLAAVTGAYPIDVDGDGLTDLVVLRIGENVILRGLGDCRFARANEALGFDGGDGWSIAFSATWEDATASLPTLAVGDYLALDDQGTPTTDCADSQLFRPRPGAATYATAVSLSPGWCALSMLFSDWDRSGRRDLRVSNDRHYYRDGEEQLWRIEPGTAPQLYTRDDGWARLQLFGMGIASQDLTGDGLPEVFLTSQGDNKLQTLADGPGRPAYEDMALQLGVTAQRPYAGGDVLPSTAWHPEFGDVNNDGFADLFISKGNVGGEPDHAEKDPSDLLIGQSDGTFVEGADAAGIMRFGLARGAALVDLDLDGLLDLVQVVRNENVEVWRNVGSGHVGSPQAMGHWLGIRLEQAGPDRDAIGSWIEVRTADRTVQRESTIGGGHASGQLGWTHVGLGAAERAELRVTWPDGEVGPWLPVVADRFVEIERGATAARPWRP